MPRSYGVTNEAPYAAAPAVGLAGDTYYNTATKLLYVSDGTAWQLPGVKASARYALTTFTTSATPLTVQILPYTVKGFDDANAVSATTGVWTCQFAGVYSFSFYVGLLTTAVQHNLYYYKNGAQLTTNARGPLTGVTASAYYETPSTVVERCVVGDTVDCRIAVNQASVVLRTGTESMFCVAYQHA